MKILRNNLNVLRKTEYLTTKDIWTENFNIKFEPLLLKNGLIVKDQLLNIWRNTKVNWAKECTNTQHYKSSEYETRLSFVKSEEFQNNYNEFLKAYRKNSESIEFKTTLNCVVDNEYDDGGFLSCRTNNTTETSTLIAEYFVDTTDGLEKFYNLQRERKIWWMRYSADPSRFLVVPYDLCKEMNDDHLCLKSKSITIKAQFPFGLANMESITMAPLVESSSLDDAKFSVIRSVINLNLTTSGMWCLIKRRYCS